MKETTEPKGDSDGDSDRGRRTCEWTEVSLCKRARRARWKRRCWTCRRVRGGTEKDDERVQVQLRREKESKEKERGGGFISAATMFDSLCTGSNESQKVGKKST